VKDHEDFTPDDVSAFYREPTVRQKENEAWKEVTRLSFEAIDTAALEDLLASSRERGVYKREAQNFLDGGEQAGKVSLTEGAFKGKKAASVLQGFRNVVKKDFEDTLRVIGNEEGVYLINTEVS
jgi:hypothetical protein